MKHSVSLTTLSYLLALVGAANAQQSPLTHPLWNGNPPDFVADVKPESMDAAGTVANVGMAKE